MERQLSGKVLALSGSAPVIWHSSRALEVLWLGGTTFGLKRRSADQQFGNSHMFCIFVLSGTVILPFHSANTFVISWNGRLSAVSVPPFSRRTAWIVERQKTAALQGTLTVLLQPCLTLIWSQLLDSARDSAAGRGKIKFAEFLEKEKDFSILGDILEKLDATLIPPSPFDIRDAHSVEQVEHALAAVHNLSVVFDCVGRLPSQPSGSFYSRCFDMLLERWTDVVKWMVYVIVNAPAAANDDNIIVVFAHTLNQILRHTATENAQKEELRSIPYTSNLICVLLCWTSPSRGYYFASQTSSDPCIIISLLEGFVRAEDGCHHFQTQIKSLSSRSRRKVLESLVLRPQFWLSDPLTNSRLQATLVTLELLVRALKIILLDPAIMAECTQLNIVSDYSTAFHLFCDRLITPRTAGGQSRITSWRSFFAALISFFHDVVLNLAKDRRKAFRDMKCQLVACALQCMLHVDNEVPDKNTALGFILTDTVNYLTYSDVYRALLPDYPGELIAKVRARDISKEVRLNCLRLEQRFVLASETFDKRKDIPINMCSNLKVRF